MLVYQNIDRERDYQDKKWGDQNDRRHTPGDFIVFMQDYLTEAAHKASREHGWEPALDVLRKVVALGVACLEVRGCPPRSEHDFVGL